MNCPNCKYPNPSGVTYCQMCYEVFNRSAAESYLLKVNQEKRARQRAMAPRPAPWSRPWKDFQNFIAQLDWDGIKALAWRLIQPKLGMILAAAGGLAAIGLGILMCSPGFRFKAGGAMLAYSFSANSPPTYLIGLTSSYKSWSERDGQFDTPMEDRRIEDIGTIVMRREGAGRRDETIYARPKEWIQVQTDGATSASTSRNIPLNSASLAPGSLVIDVDGAVAQRRYGMTARMGRSLTFLVPTMPTHRLHKGDRWQESIQWVEFMGDWKIRWQAELHWQMQNLAPCGSRTCVELTNYAELKPELQAGPSWAEKALGRLRFQGNGKGRALFDAARGCLVSNSFSYAGELQVPIDDLDRIPLELRVGRRVLGAGAVAIQFDNKTDVHRTDY